MATVSILNLQPIATGSNTPANVLAIVDIADTTQGPSGSTVSILMSQLFRMETTPITVSAPIIDARQTWNSAGVTFNAVNVDITDSNSAAASTLQTWKVGGVVVQAISKAGGVGSGALAAVTSGQFNTAFGTSALAALTSGNQNAAVGYQSLKALTTASGNTSIGYQALASETSGNSNTAVGAEVLTSSNTGTQNTGVGYRALTAVTTGDFNTAIGINTLAGNATGSGNVAIGRSAGRYETGSDAFYVNNQDRTNTAGDKASSLIYGTFNATASSQTIVFNVGRFTISNLPTSSAGLASGELWNNAGVVNVV